MRRLGGSGGGRPMGGATLHRAIKAGGAKTANNFTKNRPPTSPNTALTLSSPSTLNLPPPQAVSAPAWISSSSSSSDASEWEYVTRTEDETVYDDYVFQSVPSAHEVHHAVSALQLALGSSSPTQECDEIEWFEPSHNLYSSKEMQRRPSNDVVNVALHLLETEPCVQRMVVSLSSDKAIWDAVMNNEVVKELRGSMHRVGSLVSESSDVPSGDEDGNMISWVVKFAKAKIMQVMDLITKIVGNVFQGDKKGDDGLDEKVKSSLLLSILVLAMVILARAKTG
ncbi:hypothetical protein SASPL_118921 [Salvia splendens]|uniref:Uncharacterized protein n=1 Tax=Salvia splendens TaxID=180675 RepID=A0A8X8ZZ51_SALSN|nr:uncharacterized protein LOC121806998 [Salvia splendens]KAG6422353.1 hypothetical protein SASPL_118921 [Salvia splendens]